VKLAEQSASSAPIAGTLGLVRVSLKMFERLPIHDPSHPEAGRRPLLLTGAARRSQPEGAAASVIHRNCDGSSLRAYVIASPGQEHRGRDGAVLDVAAASATSPVCREAGRQFRAGVTMPLQPVDAPLGPE
jgi:hypothetical protein